jgi:hypothetical protein
MVTAGMVTRDTLSRSTGDSTETSSERLHLEMMPQA